MAIQPVDVGSIKPRHVQILMQNLHSHLSAVRVAGDRQRIALARRNRKHVRIMGEQNVKRIRPHQLLRPYQIGRAELLIVDSGRD